MTDKPGGPQRVVVLRLTPTQAAYLRARVESLADDEPPREARMCGQIVAKIERAWGEAGYD